MGGVFPSPRIDHRAVRIRHYIIFINTRRLLPIHLWLFLPPTIITETYSILFPPAHDLRGSCSPLLRHHNVKNRPRRNVLGHAVVTEGDVIPNRPHPRFLQSLVNGGVLPFSVLSLRYPSRNFPHYLIMQAPQRPQNVDRYEPRPWYENQGILDHRHIELPIGPGLISLPSQHSVETSQFPPCSLEVPDNGGSVTVRI